MAHQSYHHLTDCVSELNLSLTLPAGQVFGWELLEGEWVGLVGKVVYWLRQVGTGGVSFRYASGTDCDISIDAARVQLRDFFQLDVDLPAHVCEWSRTDPSFRRLIAGFEGLRICRQEPFECLVSFIVSANNNIKRISQNLKSIRKKYGTFVCESGGAAYHAFPIDLTAATVDELRELGLGYRAPYLVKTAQLLAVPGAMESLSSLVNEMDADVARNFLLQFPGVGRKVADCVLLYSLNFPNIAPVDTHMLQVAQKLFSKSIKKDKAMHGNVQQLMEARFGRTAGWAHCFLFAADLKDLQNSIDPVHSKRVRVRE